MTHYDWLFGDALPNFPPYLQFDHPAVQDVFISGGRAVGLQHVAGVGDPVLKLLQPLGEHLVLSDDPVDPRGLLLQGPRNK